MARYQYTDPDGNTRTGLRRPNLTPARSRPYAGAQQGRIDSYNNTYGSRSPSGLAKQEAYKRSFGMGKNNPTDIAAYSRGLRGTEGSARSGPAIPTGVKPGGGVIVGASGKRLEYDPNTGNITKTLPGQQSTSRYIGRPANAPAPAATTPEPVGATYGPLQTKTPDRPGADVPAPAVTNTDDVPVAQNMAGTFDTNYAAAQEGLVPQAPTPKTPQTATQQINRMERQAGIRQIAQQMAQIQDPAQRQQLEAELFQNPQFSELLADPMFERLLNMFTAQMSRGDYEAKPYDYNIGGA